MRIKRGIIWDSQGSEPSKDDEAQGTGLAARPSRPAVSIGLFVGGRFPGNHVLPYIASQLVGAVIAALVLYLIASGKAGFELSAEFAANGYGEHSPGGYSLGAALLAEVVLTFIFLILLLGATESRWTICR